MTPLSWGNPIPGQYHPSVHGAPLVHELAAWVDALKSGDRAKSADQATKLLTAVYRTGAQQDILRSLEESIQTVVYHVQAPETVAALLKGASGACDVADTEDGVDLYQPDPDFHYVIDERSGAELEAVLDDLRCMHRYINRGARSPSRLLFVGPPGCGKTVGGLWLGSQLGVPVALVRIDGTVQSAVGGTAKKLRASFEYARDNKAMLLIDEFEAVAVPRSNQGANVGQWNRETTSALLQLLDSPKSCPPDQIVIGATNHIEIIDGAVQRRMRKHVYFYPPDRHARSAMVKKWWSKAPHEGGAKRVLLDQTEGLSGDVLERIAEEANRSAARRDERADITEADVVAATLRTVPVEEVQAALMRTIALTQQAVA